MSVNIGTAYTPGTVNSRKVNTRRLILARSDASYLNVNQLKLYLVANMTKDEAWANHEEFDFVQSLW